MCAKTHITKDNLEGYLKEVAKEYRKKNGTKTKGELVLVGGASVLLNYGFREMTVDIDALFSASSALKDAISEVGERHDLPKDWLNDDVKKTASFSPRLRLVSKYFKTFSDVLEIRTVRDEYLIAMKLKAARRYKKDLSDIVGIIYEHKRQGDPLSYEMVDRAFMELYGSWDQVDTYAKSVLEEALRTEQLDLFFEMQVAEELQSKAMIVEIDKAYPKLVNSDNINEIIDAAKQKRNAPQNPS